MTEPICNKCKTSVHKICNEETIHNQCGACRAGIFASCSCDNHTVDVTKYYCDKCKNYLLYCKNCNQCYNNDIHRQKDDYNCINCLKQKYNDALCFYKRKYPNYEFKGHLDYSYQICSIIFKNRALLVIN